MRFKISAYKVVDKDGQYAAAAFKHWTKTGKTWASKAALNCAFSYWKEGRKYCNPATGVYDGYHTNPYTVYDWQLPEDWIVLELTQDGLKEIPARQFYGK